MLGFLVLIKSIHPACSKLYKLQFNSLDRLGDCLRTPTWIIYLSPHSNAAKLAKSEQRFTSGSRTNRSESCFADSYERRRTCMRSTASSRSASAPAVNRKKFDVLLDIQSTPKLHQTYVRL